MNRLDKRYVGIHNELNGGMTDTAKIIRDAWAFGLIPEKETCKGWNAQALEGLWEKVNAEWEKYGFGVGKLPPELRARFMRIQQKAFDEARAAGWDAERDIQDE